jgi:hypothetical protein
VAVRTSKPGWAQVLFSAITYVRLIDDDSHLRRAAALQPRTQ